ncbi:MAG: hypothetical protein ABJQ96_00195, partial [Crocinitomicaceae bacterium]
VSEITHEKKKGKLVLVNGESHEGIFSYKEYGDRIIYYYGTSGNDKAIKFEEAKEIVSFTIEGRGTFYPIKLRQDATVFHMALLIAEEPGYNLYQFCQAAQGIAGFKIVGGRIQGSKYEQIAYHKRKEVFISQVTVKKIDKTINEYVDYCPELTAKVAKKEKGWKKSLLMRDFQVLLKVIREAETTCPQ